MGLFTFDYIYAHNIDFFEKRNLNEKKIASVCMAMAMACSCVLSVSASDYTKVSGKFTKTNLDYNYKDNSFSKVVGSVYFSKYSGASYAFTSKTYKGLTVYGGFDDGVLFNKVRTGTKIVADNKGLFDAYYYFGIVKSGNERAEGNNSPYVSGLVWTDWADYDDDEDYVDYYGYLYYKFK